MPVRDEAIAAFWQWFKEHAAEIRSAASHLMTEEEKAILSEGGYPERLARITAELKAQLETVHPSLTWELGIHALKPDATEFIISADGNTEAFPSVIALHAAAPEIPDWKFTRFRPRRNVNNYTLRTEHDKTLNGSDIRVKVKKRDGKADVVLYVPGWSPAWHSRLLSMGLLMLDVCLGEYTVETWIGAIDCRDLSQASPQAIPLAELPAIIDRMFLN